MTLVLKDEEIREYHLKKLYELSKDLEFVVPQLREPSYEQKQWLVNRLKGSARSWERWHGMIEEWTPFSRIDGQFINIWREYKK